MTGNRSLFKPLHNLSVKQPMTWKSNYQFVIQAITWKMNLSTCELFWTIWIPNELGIQIPTVYLHINDKVTNTWSKNRFIKIIRPKLLSRIAGSSKALRYWSNIFRRFSNTCRSMLPNVFFDGKGRVARRSYLEQIFSWSAWKSEYLKHRKNKM